MRGSRVVHAQCLFRRGYDVESVLCQSGCCAVSVRLACGVCRCVGVVCRIPDWTKAVFGLSLPIMANISEIVRGAVLSVPTAQWEAAESLAFSRQQILWRIILPQCFKRMIPPWMNWYAILTMATPLCSLLGVEEIITLSRQAMEAEDNHPELLVPFYSFALGMFFLYCYPIARLTIRLERKYTVKL